jgi:hypothetical protein
VILVPLFALCRTVHGQKLAVMRAAHHLNYGTVQVADDWNGQDVHGAEVCRAVATAIFASQD